MGPKQKQLLLELTVLRSRYSLADIKQVARGDDVRGDAALHFLTSALEEIPVVRRAMPPVGSSHKRGSQTVVRSFVDRIVGRKVLRTNDQLEDFCRALGITEPVTDRKSAGVAIRERLEILSKARVTALIDSTRPGGAREMDAEHEPVIAESEHANGAETSDRFDESASPHN